MAKTTIAEWYQRVNATWDSFGADIPKPTPEEAVAGAKKLYRFGMKATWTGPVVVTSGRRYTYVRWSHDHNAWVLFVNPDNGWDGDGGIVHLLSHYVHSRVNHGVRPHGAKHARIEIAMIKEVIARGWLAGGTTCQDHW